MPDLSKLKSNLAKRLSQTRGQDGFTLTEMLIVIALIAMVSTFVVSNLTKKWLDAKVNATKITMRQLGTILEDYRRDCGIYPTTEQGLDALVVKPTIGPECKNYDPDGYTGKQGGGKGNKVPKDGFDGDFFYESDGRSYVLKTLGNDRMEGGEGFDKDFTSNEID